MNYCFVFHNIHKRQVRLNPKAVKNEVEILQVFCGGGDKGLLKSLRYTSGLNQFHVLLEYEESSHC